MSNLWILTNLMNNVSQFLKIHISLKSLHNVWVATEIHKIRQRDSFSYRAIVLKLNRKIIFLVSDFCLRLSNFQPIWFTVRDIMTTKLDSCYFEHYSVSFGC